MSGYFEGQTIGKEKPPWYFTAANGGLLTAAGLWDEWENREAGGDHHKLHVADCQAQQLHCEKSTTACLLLQPTHFDLWLEGDDKSLLRPAPEGYLKRKAVTKRVNSSTADAALIEEEKKLL